MSDWSDPTQDWQPQDYTNDTPAPPGAVGPDYSTYGSPGGNQLSGPGGNDLQTLQTQAPDVLKYLTQALGITDKNALARLISMAGGVTALVTGLRQGNQAVENLAQTTAKTAGFNKDAALTTQAIGNPNATNAYGSRTWSAPDASGRSSYTDTLSPGQQGLLDQTTALGGKRNVLAEQALDQVGANLSKPFGLAGSVPMADMNKMGQGIQTNLDFSKAGPIQYDPGTAQPIQMGLDYSGAPAMPVADEATRQKVTDDVIAQHKPAFDQQWDEQVRSMDTQLRNEGMGPETPAYVAQMKRILDDKGTAWNELVRGATQEGLTAMNTRYAENMQARQEGVGEVNTKGNFANAAQGQGAEQLLAWQAAKNAAQGQGAGQISQAGQFHNAAQGQGVGQYLAGTAANQAGRGQQFGEYTTGYQAPALLASSLQAGGTPNVPNFGTPTGATLGQAQANPLLAGALGSSVAAGNTSLTSEFLTKQLPKWFS